MPKFLNVSFTSQILFERLIRSRQLLVLKEETAEVRAIREVCAIREVLCKSYFTTFIPKFNFIHCLAHTLFDNQLFLWTTVRPLSQSLYLFVLLGNV